MADKKSNGHGKTIAAGITGAVVGAGVALTAAKILGNSENRKKITGALENVKDKIKKAAASAKKNAGELAEKAESEVKSAVKVK